MRICTVFRRSCAFAASSLCVAAFAQTPGPNYRSHISIYDLRDHSVHVVYTADTVFEAPNWSRDSKFLLANSGGALFHFVLQPDLTATPSPVALDHAFRCNNDHGMSPDASLIAFSAIAHGAKGSQVYLANADGSAPHLVVPEMPSYFHGWSPDGRWLAIVSQREGNFDIYRIPAGGGAQERLTSNPGHDDGPDYSPDGKWIYINSDRSGTEHIWRFPADGAGPNDAKAEQITSDDYENWFPHPSPDGKWLVFLSFPKGTAGHNARLPIKLRMLPLNHDTVMAKIPQDVTSFFGGQGTINVNSWSPDSTRFAFVSFEPIP